MKRLSDDGGAPAGLRAMIAAGRADMPSAATLDRILVRIEDGPPPRGGNGRRLVLVAGGLVAAVAIALLLAHRGGDDRPAPVREPAARPPSALAPARPSPALAPAPPRAVVSALPEELPPPPPPRSAPARAHHASPPPTSPPPSEVSLVEEARAALTAGDHRAALAAAARHATLYPAGVLVEEREAIRIEALAGSGDRGAARQRLRDFVHRFPRSSYRRHLEELLPAP